MNPVRQQLIDTAARAMPGVATAIAYDEGTAVLDAVLPLIADHIEAVRDDPAAHHETCSLTEAAALVRSLAGEQ